MTADVTPMNPTSVIPGKLTITFTGTNEFFDAKTHTYALDYRTAITMLCTIRYYQNITLDSVYGVTIEFMTLVGTMDRSTQKTIVESLGSVQLMG